MNDTPDSFIYKFIFDLGKYQSFNISLLGGRFFTTYSDKFPIVNDSFIAEYKTFLLERLTSANTFDSNVNSNSNLFINWIKYFIEYELINIEYRDLYKKFMNPDGQTSFSLYVFHAIFDILFFDSISLSKKIDTFIIRLEKIPKYFNAILEHLEQIPFTSILELFYCSSVISDYLNYDEEKISSLNINLIENSSYILQKANLIQYFDTFRKKIIEILQNYSFPEINLELRRENFAKTLEYIIPKTKINIKSDMENITHFKDNLISKFIPIFKIDVSNDQFLPELLKISKKTKISSNELQEQYQKIYNEILNNLPFLLSTKEKKTFPFDVLTFNETIIAFNNLFISSTRLKRNSNPQFIQANESSYLGPLFISTLTEIIPSIYFLESAVSSSYVYNVLRVSETEQALKMFLIYLYLQIDNLNNPDIQAALLYQLILISELALLDITVHKNDTLNRSVLIQTFQHTFAKNEIESEILLDQLVNLPGSYYTTYIILQSLIDRFLFFKNNHSLDHAERKMLDLIELIYGAPPKLVFQEIEKMI